MTALGAAAGSAVGAILIPFLIWRDVPAMVPTIGVLVLGAASGLLWGLTRRPTILEAAAQADRQLNLSDLLGTALWVRGSQRESNRDDAAGPWLQSVLLMADAACAVHAPSQVILRRLNARAWGGVAVAAALVVTLSALSTREPMARAAAAASGGERPSALRLSPEVGRGTDSAANRSRAPAMARSPGTGPGRENEGAMKTGVIESADARGGNASTSSSPAGAPGDAGAGGGAGRARGVRPGGPPGVARGQTPGSAPQHGKAASGGGGESSTIGNDPSAPGALGGASTPAPAAPPWHSAGWADDVRQANEALDAGGVPDAHRDLVRQYFDRR